MATDVGKKLDEHRTEFRGMLNDTDNTVEKLTARLAALETEKKKKKKKKNDGDASPPAPDPWAGFNPSGTAIPAANPPAADGADFSLLPLERHHQGMVPLYGEQNALNTTDALALGHRIRGLLPEGLNSAIIDIDAGYLCNRQVVFKIKVLAPLMVKELCWQIRSHLTVALRAAPVCVLGREVYAVVEPSLSRRDRNKCIGIASRVLLSRLPDPECVIVDFRAGAIYFKGGDSVASYIELGRMHHKKKWAWDATRVKEFIKTFNLKLDVADLDSETVSALADE